MKTTRRRIDVGDLRWLTVDEGARILRVNVQSLYRWIRWGRVPASRIGKGRTIRVDRFELERMLIAKPNPIRIKTVPAAGHADAER